MAQDITIKLAGKPYPLTADNPEQEQLIRRSADEINSIYVTGRTRMAMTDLCDPYGDSV